MLVYLFTTFLLENGKKGKCQPKKGGLIRKLPKEWIPYFQQHGMTSRLRNALRTKKWTTTQIALVVRTYPDYKDYPDASPEPTPELSEESSPGDSGVDHWRLHPEEENRHQQLHNQNL